MELQRWIILTCCKQSTSAQDTMYAMSTWAGHNGSFELLSLSVVAPRASQRVPAQNEVLERKRGDWKKAVDMEKRARELGVIVSLCFRGTLWSLSQVGLVSHKGGGDQVPKTQSFFLKKLERVTITLHTSLSLPFLMPSWQITSCCATPQSSHWLQMEILPLTYCFKLMFKRHLFLLPVHHYLSYQPGRIQSKLSKADKKIRVETLVKGHLF